MGVDEIPFEENLQQNSAEVGEKSPEDVDQRHDPGVLPEPRQVHAQEAGHGDRQRRWINQVLRRGQRAQIMQTINYIQ